MSSVDVQVLKLQNAQQRVQILAHNTDAFLLEPELLSTVLEELAVVLEELQQHHEELYATRQALEAQRQRYQELFDFAPDGYLVTNVQGVIQEANQAASQLFRVRQAFLVGKPLIVFVAKPDRRAFHTYLSHLQVEAQHRNWDLHLKPRKGEVFPAVITTSAIRSSQNVLLGWRWLVRDITDLRQAAVMVRESSTEKRLDDLRSTFVQTVSHELRTPMTIIVTSIELLKRHAAAANEAKQQTYFDRMQQAVWRVNALLSDVLLYDEMSSSRRLFSPAQLNLNASCHNAVRKLQSSEDNRPITIDSHSACDAIYLDAELVQHMLDRLLSNALTYSPNDSTVCVTLRCDSSPTSISVHNEGTISQEQRERLFEPFYRPEATAHVPGAGLGLAIVKKAVALHGGAVAVASSATTGTTFSITLPKLEA